MSVLENFYCFLTWERKKHHPPSQIKKLTGLSPGLSGKDLFMSFWFKFMCFFFHPDRQLRGNLDTVFGGEGAGLPEVLWTTSLWTSGFLWEKQVARSIFNQRFHAFKNTKWSKNKDKKIRYWQSYLETRKSKAFLKACLPKCLANVRVNPSHRFPAKPFTMRITNLRQNPPF